MPGDLAPPLEDGDRQRGRSRHHQAQPTRSRRPALARRAVCHVEGRQQFRVDRRHGHEERDPAGGHPLPGARGVEGRQELTAGARPQRAPQHVHDAVHVVERQDVQNAIVHAPAPRASKRGHLRLEVGVRQDDTLRPAGGAAGIKKKCRVRGARCRVLRAWRRGTQRDCRTIRRQPAGSVARRDGREDTCLVVADDHTGLRVLDDEVPFGRGLGRRERHGHRARAPDAPLPCDVVETGRDQERDPSAFAASRLRRDKRVAGGELTRDRAGADRGGM